MKPTLLALVALAFSILLGAPSRAGAEGNINAFNPYLLNAGSEANQGAALRLFPRGMVERLTVLFESRDTDGNGLLSPIEWRGSTPMLINKLDRLSDRLPRRFLKIDHNRNGSVSFSEFARALGAICCWR
jgi:hypothetical protein